MINELWALDDAGGWGRDLVFSARRRKIKAHLFANTLPPPGSHVFMRINQGGERMEKEKKLANELAPRCTLIPSIIEIREYEDKLRQAQRFSDWMPPTFVCINSEQAFDALKQLTFPFVSKSRTGSASRNIRMVENVTQAYAEIHDALAPEANGISAPHKLGEHVQRDYLIWQKFCPNNEYDYRICKIGRGRMILRRYNRPDVPFASGSGNHEPVIVLDDETKEVLRYADGFFEDIKTNWCGIDLVRDGEDWYVLETTLGWSQKAYADCTFWGTKRRGYQIWDLFLDELEGGVFG